MTLTTADKIPYHVARTTFSELLGIPSVAEFVIAADATTEIAALRNAVNEIINTRRRNEGKDHVSTSVFSLLERDYSDERFHELPRKSVAILNRLQRVAAKALNVPRHESSLPWMIASTQATAVA